MVESKTPKKKHYRIRLYKAHDLDLVTLTERYDFDITKAVYSCLSAFVDGRFFVAEQPKPREQPWKAKHVTERTITLDPVKDAAAIAVMESMNEGFRNCFLKNLLRQYIALPITDDFLNSSESFTTVTAMFAPLRAGRPHYRIGIRKSDSKTDSALPAVNNEAWQLSQTETVSEDVVKTSADTGADRSETSDVTDSVLKDAVEERNATDAETEENMKPDTEMLFDQDKANDLFAQIFMGAGEQ